METTPQSSRPSADLELAVRGIVFSAAGTAGQRCTSLRRLIVHESIADNVVDRVASAYATQLQVGSPFDSGVLVGPLINEAAFETMQKSLSAARADGGTVVCGGDRVGDSGFYVTPALVRMPAQTEVVRAETFAPILYVLTYTDFDDAIALHNGVPQGLSSSIFTLDQREAERFLAADGSGLRHREREHRNVRCGDRRRIRRGEGDWRRTRVGFGFVEGIHAPSHQYRQLLGPASAGSRGRVRLNTCRAKSVIASINSGSADNCGAWSVPRLTTWAPGTSLCMAR